MHREHEDDIKFTTPLNSLMSYSLISLHPELRPNISTRNINKGACRERIEEDVHRRDEVEKYSPSTTAKGKGGSE